MKWTFGSKGPMSGGSVVSLGLVGTEGEYYFHPSKLAKLKGPPTVLTRKSKTVPLFPHSNVLAPLGTEMLNVLEMRHRQLLTDVGPGGYFGFVYHSQQQQKLGLVGTLAKINDRKLLDDGRAVVVIEGVERFYIEDIKTDKPYMKAKVQCFGDYIENREILDEIENKIFDDVRLNLKFMKLIYPQKNFSLNKNVVTYRPPVLRNGIRTFNMLDEKTELDRRSKFSFAIMEMLSLSSPTKLSLMQEHLLEKRYTRILKILEAGGKYLKDELKNRKIVTDDEINTLEKELLLDTSDIDMHSSLSYG
jgi:ATP-dependent Lon protease